MATRLCTLPQEIVMKIYPMIQLLLKKCSRVLNINAIFPGDREIVDVLLDHRANISVQNNLGYSPIHLLAKNGKEFGFQDLFER